MRIIGQVKQKRVNEDVVALLKSLGITEKAEVRVEKKANESLNETNATDGANWVPTEMARSIIKKARANSAILSRLPSENVINMKSKTWESPLEGTDPSFELGAENTDVPGTATTTSKPTTPKATITAKRFSASVYMSGEVEEDADVEGGLRSVVEGKIATAFSELVEKHIINGDTVTASTGNVNSDDGAPAAKSYYLGHDGLVKTAVTNSKTLDAGTLALSDFTAVRRLMGTNGLKVSDLLWIMNPETYFTALDLSQVQTADAFGRAATVIEGELEKIQGIQVMTNENFLKAEADGKRSTTEGNNTLGRFLCLYLPSLFVGFRRRLKITVTYLDDTDQFRISAHTRMGLTVVNGSTGTVAMGRNVTVS